MQGEAKRNVIILAIVVPWVLVMWLALAWYLQLDTRQFLSVKYVVPTQGADPVVARIYAGLHDETATKCGPKIGCTEAYVGDNLTLYKFSSKVTARRFTREDTATRYNSDWIVIEFTNPEMSAQDKAFAETDMDEWAIAE